MAPSATSPQRYPLQYVDVVIPRFLAKVGDPKTEDLHQSAVEAALKKNSIKFDGGRLSAMFEEADFEVHDPWHIWQEYLAAIDSNGYLSKPHLIAAATGRYTKRQFGMADWLLLIADVMGKPVDRLDSTVDMSAYLSATEDSVAEWRHNGVQPLTAREGPYRGASYPSVPTSGQLTSRSGGGLQSGSGSMRSGPKGSNISSPSQQPSKLTSLHAAVSKNDNANSARSRNESTAASSPRREEAGAQFTTGRLEASKLNSSLTPQYTKYLDSMDLAYGGDELGYWTHRNQRNPPPASSADIARQTKQLSETYPFDTSKPPSSLAKTRQSLNGFRASSKPGFERFHRMLSPHDMDLKQCLGQQIYPEPMGQTEPLRSRVTNTGLPQQNYVQIGSQVPPPKTFGCQPWWN